MKRHTDSQLSLNRKLTKSVIVFLGIFLFANLFAMPSVPPIRNSNSVLKSTLPSTSLSQDGVNLGVGRNLTAYEYAQSTNASRPVNIPNNQSNAYQLVSIDTPPEWTGYNLFSDVSGLTDNNSWLVNGGVNGQSPWVYREYDLMDWNNGSTGNISENSWGWYGNNPWTQGGSGGLCLNHGYYKEAYQPIGDPQDSREFCAFNQTLSVDRGSVSAVKVIFSFNKTVFGTTYGAGWDTLFIMMNGFRADFHVFDSSYSTNTWHRIEYDVPALSIPTNFNSLSNIMFQIGIYQQTSGCYWESATEMRDAVVLDNISLYIQAAVKPSQVQLKINGTSVQDFGYGAGNLTLNTPCPNPSSVNYLPTWVNFTIGSSIDVKLTTSITQYVNHTQITKVYVGDFGSEFTVSNNSVTNWTGYFYAFTPNFHSQYNFSVFTPGDWTPWALFDPTPTEVLTQPGISIGLGVLGVASNRANDHPGRWRMEFSSPNYVTVLTSYRNTTITPGPTDWTPVDSYFAGEFLNITAQISGSESVTSTTAQLEIRFPNGTVWSEHSQEKSVDSSGSVIFNSFQIPLSGPDYLAGDYTAFVTWNNTRGGMQCNETGLRSKIIPIRHLSQLVPDDAFLAGVINGTVKKIRVTYSDLLSGTPITGASVAFVNFNGSIQTLAEIAPGYYSTDLLVAVAGESGYYNITVNATHTHFTPQQQNVTLDVILDSSLIASIYPTIAVQSNENFTLDLRYNQTGKALGIDEADIWISYPDDWTLTPGGEIGEYTLTGNNSHFPANTIQKLEIGAQKLGFRPQNLSINVKIMPRTAIFAKIYMNGTDSTLLPTYKMNITTWLNLTVQLCDEVDGTALPESEVNITGVNATPSPLNVIGNYFEILLNSSVLGKGVHFLTLVGDAANHVLATTVIQITVDQLTTMIHTDDEKTTYYKLVGENFAFKVGIDDLVFGGNLTTYTISYEWRFGSGNLTGPDAEDYFTAQLANLPKGTWTITIRVAGEGSDYAFDDLLIKLVVNVPVEKGIPDWVIYSIVVAIGAVIVIFAFYETKFKYPPIIRDVRSLKNQVKRGKTLTVQVRAKDVPKTFTGGYLAESKGALSSTQQVLLKEQHIKTGKGISVYREVKEIVAPPPSEPIEPQPAAVPSVVPPQVPAKPAPEVPKPAEVTPAATPVPAAAPEQVTKPVSPEIAPIPERFLQLMKEKEHAPTVKPLPPQVRELPAVKALPQVKALPAKPATKPIPKPEEKPAEKAGDEKK